MASDEERARVELAKSREYRVYIREWEARVRGLLAVARDYMGARYGREKDGQRD